ncbi:hypothetical protein BKG95_00100 [Rodentibacter pneumotropicus]|uniref:Porin family protein n=1 Tax=Rodentibacter pneumotropicus TaxID=758 RepID=A0AAW5L8E8_9PAST|nr:porin family protein [Rodentibacter pneumotropicus]MCQ9120534.1 porin family protein [Rodentibacter pneumotropicus]OOF69280.1 hypothetical protein BKG95_00100 [Rodentibacter pneumotropicus]
MKKLIITTLFVLPVAASAVDNFSGWHIGGELSTVKYSMTGEVKGSGSQGTGLAIIGGYGFDFSQNFVGIIEGKFKLSNAKITDEDDETLKEKYQASIAYLQGYRITENIMPYIKVGASVSQIDYSSDKYEGVGVRGIDYGLGVKYAIDKNLALGVNFTRHNLAGGDDSVKFKGNRFGLNLSYRF